MTSKSSEQVAPAEGEIYDETGRASAAMFIAGVFVGLGIMALVLGYELISIQDPAIVGSILIVGGIVIWRLALKILPDARTIATFVEESEYFNT